MRLLTAAGETIITDAVTIFGALDALPPDEAHLLLVDAAVVEKSAIVRIDAAHAKANAHPTQAVIGIDAIGRVVAYRGAAQSEEVASFVRRAIVIAFAL